jgi:hypothetical protein
MVSSQGDHRAICWDELDEKDYSDGRRTIVFVPGYIDLMNPG